MPDQRRLLALVVDQARGQTFVEVEMGLEPPRLRAHALRPAYNKRFLRRITEETLDNLRRFLRRD